MLIHFAIFILVSPERAKQLSARKEAIKTGSLGVPGRKLPQQPGQTPGFRGAVKNFVKVVKNGGKAIAQVVRGAVTYNAADFNAQAAIRAANAPQISRLVKSGEVVAEIILKGVP